MSPLTPEFVVAFEPRHDVWSFVFAPDGSAAYVQLHFLAIDVWGTLVYFWPEICGGLIAIGGLGLLMTLVRALRRRQVPGERHCRQCNYVLGGLAVPEGKGEQRCPECGTVLEARAVIIGRSLPRRLAPGTALFVSMLVGYALALVFNVPRSGSISDWVVWPSSTLQRFAESKRLSWLDDRSEGFERILRIDLADGRSRPLFTHKGGTLVPLAVAPDGHSLFLGRVDHRGLDEIDTSSGRLIRSLFLWDDVQRETAVLGFSPDGRRMYFRCTNSGRDLDLVAATEPETGAVHVLLQTFENAEDHKPPIVPIPGQEARFLVADDSLSIVAPGGKILRSFDLSMPFGWYPQPCVTSGQTAFLVTIWDGILELDLRTGEPIALFPLPGGSSDALCMDASADGRVLAVTTGSNYEPYKTFVRLEPQRPWLQLAKDSTPAPISGAHLSDDGRWVAGFAPTAQSRGYEYDLLLFRLPAPEE